MNTEGITRNPRHECLVHGESTVPGEQAGTLICTACNDPFEAPATSPTPPPLSPDFVGKPLMRMSEGWVYASPESVVSSDPT
ncbi:MAG TPA: hypothetical protein VFT87_04565 [Candidatus Saccharimonadales bacterium]|nr:hypothetical protein [Candidatus Saccharimonadales bacterium]